MIFVAFFVYGIAKVERKNFWFLVLFGVAGMYDYAILRLLLKLSGGGI